MLSRKFLFISFIKFELDIEKNVVQKGAVKNEPGKCLNEFQHLNLFNH